MASPYSRYASWSLMPCCREPALNLRSPNLQLLNPEAQVCSGPEIFKPHIFANHFLHLHVFPHSIFRNCRERLLEDLREEGPEPKP